MSTIKSVNVSEELSPLGGLILYINHDNGKQVRLEVPFGAEHTYANAGIPVTYAGTLN